MNDANTKPLPDACRVRSLFVEPRPFGVGGSAFSRRRPDSFTLTELLVSTAILTVLVLVMFNVVDNASRAWRLTEQRVDAFREARAALFIISRDLSSIIDLHQKNSALPAFVLNNGHPHGTELLADIPDATPDKPHADNVFFFCTLPANAQESGNLSDICSVGYYMRYRQMSDVDPNAPEMFRKLGSYALVRYMKSSNATFSVLESGTRPLFQGATTDDILARNVIDFYVKPLRADGTTVTPWDINEMPAFVEISLTAFNYATAKQFDKADWQDRTGKTYKEKRQTFTTRIKINAP
jgi:type II secretory pathway pseudopilin PulG